MFRSAWQCTCGSRQLGCMQTPGGITGRLRFLEFLNPVISN